MTRFLSLLTFLGLNFGGLALGARFTGPGVNSEWYQTLARAPWTPDGWVFGTAWTLIMVTFSSLHDLRVCDSCSGFILAMSTTCSCEQRHISLRELRNSCGDTPASGHDTWSR